MFLEGLVHIKYHEKIFFSSTSKVHYVVLINDSGSLSCCTIGVLGESKAFALIWAVKASELKQ